LNAGIPDFKSGICRRWEKPTGKLIWDWIIISFASMLNLFPNWKSSMNWQLPKGKWLKLHLRINPNVSAHTHHYITTGLSENKFGINMSDLNQVIDLFPTLPNVKLIGIHFHIGSQITDMTSFQDLCVRVNELQELFLSRNIALEHINVGGGLGINYEHPIIFQYPDFEAYFKIFRDHLQLQPNQTSAF
jgi:diaminopimelate decarboxylase